ncbi:MAG: glycosyltransferase [Deltaproteobacteria bacterium]|nr:MAG: glycosyltransferase [Deltaproteobacteria bacterium]
MNFSVLMAVYRRERPQFFREALQSLADQSHPAAEVVLVVDGPVGDDLEDVIGEYRETLPLKVVRLPENRGLAAALNEGLAHCSHPWVARMDSDDVALPGRFARQTAFLDAHPEIDVCGAWIEERDMAMAQVLSIREVPLDHDAIRRFARRRNPISHPVCFFRKESVLAVGGYPPIGRAQDYALWALMLVRGYRFANLPEILLRMRTGEGLLGRRGFGYFLCEIDLLRYQRAIGFLGRADFLVNMLIRFTFRIVPDGLKKRLYRLTR